MSTISPFRTSAPSTTRSASSLVSVAEVPSLRPAVPAQPSTGLSGAATLTSFAQRLAKADGKGVEKLAAELSTFLASPDAKDLGLRERALAWGQVGCAAARTGLQLTEEVPQEGKSAVRSLFKQYEEISESLADGGPGEMSNGLSQGLALVGAGEGKLPVALQASFMAELGRAAADLTLSDLRVELASAKGLAAATAAQKARAFLDLHGNQLHVFTKHEAYGAIGAAVVRAGLKPNTQPEGMALHRAFAQKAEAIIEQLASDHPGRSGNALAAAETLLATLGSSLPVEALAPLYVEMGEAAKALRRTLE